MRAASWYLLAAGLAGAMGAARAVSSGSDLVLPSGLPSSAFSVPADNPLTTAKVALGRQLFFDTRLSVDNTTSCATCHAPDMGFADGRPVSVGPGARKAKRHAPAIVNRAFGAWQFWDGRARSLEELILIVFELPAALGNTLEALERRLGAIETYPAQFQEAFGGDVSARVAAQAIAAFVRTILSGNSAFDRFEAGDKNALTAAAQRGLALFRGKANCVRCHTGFTFTDEEFHNTGVGMYEPEPDLGRYLVTRRNEDKGAFKTPTLRDVALTAPYMHDGSLKTLEEVVRFYDKGGIKNPYLDRELRPLRLTPQEREDLVALLKALTGTAGPAPFRIAP